MLWQILCRKFGWSLIWKSMWSVECCRWILFFVLILCSYSVEHSLSIFLFVCLLLLNYSSNSMLLLFLYFFNAVKEMKWWALYGVSFLPLFNELFEFFVGAFVRAIIMSCPYFSYELARSKHSFNSYCAEFFYILMSAPMFPFFGKPKKWNYDDELWKGIRFRR